MTRKIKVIGVKVRYGQSVDARIAPQKPDWTTHQKNGLNDIANGVKQDQGRDESSRAAPFKEDEQEADHHGVDADTTLDDQKVLPGRILDEECVDFLGPYEGVVSETLTFGKVLDFLVLQRRQK